MNKMKLLVLILMSQTVQPISEYWGKLNKYIVEQYLQRTLLDDVEKTKSLKLINKEAVI